MGGGASRCGMEATRSGNGQRIQGAMYGLERPELWARSSYLGGEASRCGIEPMWLGGGGAPAPPGRRPRAGPRNSCTAMQEALEC